MTSTKEVCPLCEGTGNDPGGLPVCRMCQGRGFIQDAATLACQQPAASVAGAVAASIDTPEFRELLADLLEASEYNDERYDKPRAALIAYVDAQLAAAPAAPQSKTLTLGEHMLNVLITTTYIDPNVSERAPASIATTLIPCTTEGEADAIINSIWNQRNGGNAAPSGLVHDAIVIGASSVTARDAEQAAPAAVTATHGPVGLTNRKTADIATRGYNIIGYVLRSEGGAEVCISAESAVRWLPQADYWRLMHEQDGSLFAQPAAPAVTDAARDVLADAKDAERYRWLRDAKSYVAVQPHHKDLPKSERTGWTIRLVTGNNDSLDDAIDAALRTQSKE